MKVIVTGGAGFVGSHIVDELVRGGHEVVVVDDLDRVAHDGIPDGLSTSAQYLWRDVRDVEAWADVLGGAHGICHQAAKVGLGVDFADVGDYVGRNVAGTAAMLQALHNAQFAGRIVLASSMAVYGEGRYRCAVHGLVRPSPRRRSDLDAAHYEPTCPQCDGELVAESVPEDHWLDPRNVYATTKLTQEGLCNAFAREHPSAIVTSLRYHNVYGPRMPRDTPYSGVAAIFRSAYARGEAPRVMEDGGQRRDFVHVTDVAHANVLALTNKKPAPGPLNVCTGTPRTVLEMAVALRPRGGPVPKVVGGYRLGDIRHVFGSAEKAASVLGFHATIMFDDGMHGFSEAPLRESTGRVGQPDGP